MVERSGWRSLGARRRVDDPDDDLCQFPLCRLAPQFRHDRGAVEMEPVDSALDVAGLTKSLTATGKDTPGGIRPISFSLQAGTFFTLLGPSRCRKTTTLRCLAGLEAPYDRTI